MSGISAINLKNVAPQDVKNTQSINVQFRATSTQALGRNPETDSFKKKGLGTGAKVAIGTGVLLGVLTLVDVIACKGKHIKSIFKIGAKESPLPTPKPPAQEGLETTNKAVKETIETFKSKGRFEKGKAILNDGEEFTGEITHELNNGNRVSMYYNRGEILSSKIKDKAGNITHKHYSHCFNDPYTNGKISSVKVEQNGKVISKSYFDYDFYGELKKVSRVTPDKSVVVMKSMRVEDSYINAISAENKLYTTGLRENMPKVKWGNGNGCSYPDAQIVDIIDKDGNHTITRKFVNGWEDVLKLNKDGTSGTIEHYGSGGLVSKIKRNFKNVYEDFTPTTETYFGGGSYESGYTTKHLNFIDELYDANDKLIKVRNSYIDASENYGLR